MILLDSNILIYSAQSNFAYLRPLVSDPLNAVSASRYWKCWGIHHWFLLTKHILKRPSKFYMFFR